jgi:glycosyltransferase involved in cell wall biosynthesis
LFATFQGDLMNTKDLISIIIPVYNGAMFLPSLVDNFESQTYRNFELIFVNDSSPDNSRQVISELQVKYKFIICIDRDKNGGMGPARNTGIKAAKGEYLLFVDQDDSFSNSYLEIMKYIIDKDNADLAYCGVIIQTKYNAIHTKLFLDKDNNFYKLYQGHEVFSNIFAMSNLELSIIGGPWGKIIRKSFYDKTNILFPDCLIYEDVIMNFKELSLADTVACYNSELYYLNRQYSGSASAIYLKKMCNMLPNISSILSEHVNSYNLSKEKSSAVLRFYFFIIVTQICLHFNVDYFRANNYDLLIRYLQSFPNIDFKGNEHFIFFQFLMFYIYSNKIECVDLFVKFIDPFREVIRSWIGTTRNTEQIFSDDQKAELQIFLETTIKNSNSFNNKHRKVIYSAKIIRQLYRFFKLIGSGSYLHQLDKIAIIMSGWFDDKYFKENNTDLQTNLTAIDYFTKYGWCEYRNPNRWFNIKSFLSTYPEIKKRGVNPLVSFFANGLNPKRPF